MLPQVIRSLFDVFAGKPKSRRSPGRSRRRLKLEQLENRQLLANDLATISGVVYEDANDNGAFDSGTDTRLQNVALTLFRDVDNDGNFEPTGDDAPSIASATSNAQGQYSFSGLTAGRYFLRQTQGSGDSAGLLLRDSFETIVVDANEADGESTTIDSFDIGLTAGGPQSVAALPGASDGSGESITGVLGGERDLFVSNNVAAVAGSEVSMIVDASDSNLLRYNLDDGSIGTLYVIYDGAADTLPADKGTVDPNGLGNIDLTEAGTRTGFQFFARTDTALAPVNLVVTVFDGTNQHSVTSAIAVSLTAQEILVPFSSFTNNGVDMTSVGAIRLEISTTVSANGAIEFAGTVGPTVIPEDLQNLNPMSLGDRVFADTNNNGVLDVGESGLAGVVLQLFLDADGDGILDTGETAVLDGSNNPITATTDASGNYLFTNLLPNKPTAGNPAVFEQYIVVIASNQTPLTNRISSTGNDVAGVAPNPNNNVDGDDNGTLVGTNIVSGGILLTAGAETGDGDSDANSNVSLDFGFAPAPVDLALTKTVSATTVGVGGQITYTLTVTNNGPNAVSGIEVDDNLPTGFTLATAGNPGSITSSVNATRDFIWTVGNLAASASASVQVIVDVGTTVAPAAYTNTATIALDRMVGVNDTVSGNNSDDVDVTVQPRFDLEVTKTDGQTTVTTGSLVTYTITVDNDGPSAATNVVVTDTLPTGMVFVSATSNSTSFGTGSGQNYSATIASLASGETRTISLVARVLASATGTSLTNNVSITADNIATQEIGARANTASDVNTLTRVVNLNITKDDSADPVLAGGSFSYTITAFNSGSADAPNVLFSDPLPAGVTFVSGTFTINEQTPRSGAITFNSTTNQLEANLGTLLANGSSTTNRALITLNVTAAGTASGTISNTATITNADGTVSNTETTVINPNFDLTISKTDAVTQIAAGQNLTYTIIVTNSGPSTATAITVTDVLPSQLTFVSATSTSGTFSNNNGTVTGTIASLASGQRATITLVTTVKNDVPDNTTISNTSSVSVASNAGETVTTNNSATDTTTVLTFGSISGTVYADIQRDGRTAGSDLALSGVTMRLNGVHANSALGAFAERILVTDANGRFSFTNLPAGTYTLTQDQPTQFTDSVETVGTAGGTAGNDIVQSIVIAGGNNADGYLFAEIIPMSLYFLSCTGAFELESYDLI